ncbi:hypothetical protein ACFLTC_00940 [Chloroflexota bacterium]
MTYVLVWLTTIINAVLLAIALCLGLYVVTRTLRGWVTWLAGLMLWSLAGFYLFNALAVTAPAHRALSWLKPCAVMALAFGFNLSILLPTRWQEPGIRALYPPLRIPKRLERRLGTAGPVVRRLPVPLSYLLAVILIIVIALPIGEPVQPVEGPAIYLSHRPSSLLYPLAISYLIVLFALASLHQWQGWQRESRRRHKSQYLVLFAGLILAICGGLYLGLGIWLQADLPTLPADVAVGIAAIFFGYRVARTISVKEGLVLRREMLYLSLVIGLFTVGYVVVARLLSQDGHALSAPALLVIVIVGVTSLMLYDGVRAALDSLFYRQQFRLLRQNLRALAREASVGQPLPERLQRILSSLCRTLDAGRGAVAIRGGDAYECQATERAQCLGETFPPSSVEAPETVDLPRLDVENPEGMTLLVPIYAGDDQIGALLLGPKETRVPYSEEDFILLEDVADQLGTLILSAQRQEENAGLISDMLAEFRDRERALQRQMQKMMAEQQEETRPVLEGFDDQGFAALVEDALRRLYDFTYLGEHDVARLSIVDWHLQDGDDGFVTHIDRGKALSEILVESVSKLRPAGTEPERHAIPPREWHQFTILYDAYVMGELNRDIMSKLYIGEGTFNRTRRRAVRGVARAIREMEWEVQEKGMR